MLEMFSKLKHITRPVLLLLLSNFVSYQNLNAQYDINILKAAYIERITRFVEWPPVSRDTSVFRIGIFGNKEIINTFTALFGDKTIKGRPVRTELFTTFQKIKDYDLCYLEGIKESQIKNLILESNREGVLIFTHHEGFGEKGIHFNFFIEENKLKFEINHKSLADGNFKVSYILLSNSRTF